jgi:hypothetical protein
LATTKYPQEFKDDPPPEKNMNGLPDNLDIGMSVKRGQHIAFVGLLRKPEGKKRISWKQAMLHFEKFKGTEGKEISLTDRTNTKHYDYVPVKPYMRRKDLEDPTSFLDNTVLE